MPGSQELHASLLLSVRTEDLHWTCCFEASLQWQQLCLSPGKEICADTSVVWLEWSLTAPVVYFRKTNDVAVNFKLHSELIQYVIMNFLPGLRVIQQDLHLLWRSAAPLTALELYKCTQLRMGPGGLYGWANKPVLHWASTRCWSWAE